MQVVHGLCSRLKKLAEENSFTFYCLTESPPQHPPSPSHISIRKVMDTRTAHEDGDDCWLLVSCLSDEEEMEKEKARHFLQQPCCSEAKEHYLLSLLSQSNCVDSEWAKKTVEQIKVKLKFKFSVFSVVCIFSPAVIPPINHCYSCSRLSLMCLGNGLHSTWSATCLYSQLLSTHI